MTRSTILSGARMSNKKLSMRRIKEVLRLRFVCERSQREIATTIGLSSATVWDYLDRARRAQLDFEKVIALDEAALEALLFAPPPSLRRTRPMPNLPLVLSELSRKDVKLDLLWNEYVARNPRVTATVGSASIASNGPQPCRSRCAKRTRPARSCSSTTRATGWASLIHTLAKSASRSCSSRRSVRLMRTGFYVALGGRMKGCAPSESAARAPHGLESEPKRPPPRPNCRLCTPTCAAADGTFTPPRRRTAPIACRGRQGAAGAGQ